MNTTPPGPCDDEDEEPIEDWIDKLVDASSVVCTIIAVVGIIVLIILFCLSLNQSLKP